MTKGFEYSINKILYVLTTVHEKSVVLHIVDEAGTERGFFMPEKYAEIIRTNFGDADDINCHELFLAFKGFSDEDKKINATFEIVYKGAAQHY